MMNGMKIILFFAITLTSLTIVVTEGITQTIILDNLFFIAFILFAILNIPSTKSQLLYKFSFLVLSSLCIISATVAISNGQTNNINKYINNLNSNLILAEKLQENMFMDILSMSSDKNKIDEFKNQLSELYVAGENILLARREPSRFYIYEEYVNTKSFLEYTDYQLIKSVEFLKERFNTSNVDFNEQTIISYNKLQANYINTQSNFFFDNLSYGVKEFALTYYMLNIVPYIFKILLVLMFSMRTFSLKKEDKECKPELQHA